MFLGKIECKNCSQKIVPAYYAKHLKNVCPSRDFQCPGCNFDVKPCEFFNHFRYCGAFYFAMPLLIMKLGKEDNPKVKYCWDLHFLEDRKNTFCLVVSSDQEYMLSRRDLSQLPSTLWVTFFENEDCLFVSVQLLKSYLDSHTLATNFDHVNPKRFFLKIHSNEQRDWPFDFPACEKKTFTTAILTKDAYRSTFKVQTFYELSFSIEMILW
jgi:hypothetical protein